MAGINAGGNLGTDIHHSGTVAAVREAAIHGVPGIALSHYIARGRVVDWNRAERWAEAILRRLMARPWEPGTFWNVNFPHPEPEQPEPEVVFCPLDPSPLPLRYRVEGDQVDLRGRLPVATRRPGFDVDVCFGGRIAVTLIRVFDNHLDARFACRGRWHEIGLADRARSIPAGEKVWPTRVRTCHNVVIWAWAAIRSHRRLHGDRYRTPRGRHHSFIDSMPHRGRRFFHEVWTYRNRWWHLSGWRSAGVMIRLISCR